MYEIFAYMQWCCSWQPQSATDKVGRGCFQVMKGHAVLWQACHSGALSAFLRIHAIGRNHSTGKHYAAAKPAPSPTLEASHGREMLHERQQGNGGGSRTGQGGHVARSCRRASNTRHGKLHPTFCIQRRFARHVNRQLLCVHLRLARHSLTLGCLFLSLFLLLPSSCSPPSAAHSVDAG